ncbi:camphor resistance protein CrcB [Poseidonocella pacifica]|uniref:Fluoride-specific ion channel FluC n=1 Tax=Poseidonocella pacifica TaxID=871651 RepID=A0A1I0XHH6_9RHOB|nr:fluoride efflux transporter CrcB [Poseidonocella pacifica]SFB00462.1 camphor resistance protein CrcB [Poseidonocella pacifica]
MFTSLLSVAAGGAIGASLRFLSGIGIARIWGGSFPLGVLSVNVLGSFLMGVFVVVAAERGLTYLGPFVMTGLLGGFTTFSAFSLETVTLFERGEPVQAMAYVIFSILGSIAALALGILLSRGVLS